MNLTRKLLTREGFLTMVIATFTALAGVVASIPLIGYAISPLVNQPKNVWRDVQLANPDGSPGAPVTVDTIPLGQTEHVVYDNNAPLPWAGSTARTGAWLRRTGPQQFIAYAIYCTHLGCPIKWLADPQIFLCPCHGSVFNADGTVAGGPAPRPLFTYEVRAQNGKVQIKTAALPYPNCWQCIVLNPG